MKKVHGLSKISSRPSSNFTSIKSKYFYTIFLPLHSCTNFTYILTFFFWPFIEFQAKLNKTWSEAPYLRMSFLPWKSLNNFTENSRKIINMSKNIITFDRYVKHLSDVISVHFLLTYCGAVFKIAFWLCVRSNLRLRRVHKTCTINIMYSFISIHTTMLIVGYHVSNCAGRKYAKFESSILNSISFIAPVLDLFDQSIVYNGILGQVTLEW